MGSLFFLQQGEKIKAVQLYWLHRFGICCKQ